MENKSFTLIELLVVIVIIGILAGVIIVSVSSSISKANFAKAQAFSNTVQNELLGDLVSEWTFDNPSLPGEDTWGNNDGTVSGATHKTKVDGVCVYGGCMSFDGTNNYIDCGNNSSLDFTTENFTISEWVKLSVMASATEIRRGTVVVDGYYTRIDSNGLVRMMTNQSGQKQTTNTASGEITANKWYHIVYIRNGAKGYIYINGSDKTVTQPTLINPTSSTRNLEIGRYSAADSPFPGLIDDVRIYNQALSSAQIKQQYVAGLNSLLANNNISKEEYNLRIESLSQK